MSTLAARKRPAVAAKPSANASKHDITLDVLQRFRQVFRATKRHFQWVEEQCGVSGAQLWAMAELAREPGMRVSELASSLSIHQSTASNLLDKLEERALMRRERGGDDQRVVRLYLTPSGKAVVDRAPRPHQGILPDALGRMSDKELLVLQRSLDQLTRLMRMRDQDAAHTPLSDILSSGDSRKPGRKKAP